MEKSTTWSRQKQVHRHVIDVDLQNINRSKYKNAIKKNKTKGSLGNRTRVLSHSKRDRMPVDYAATR